jgi:hypothetical protein
MGSEVADNYGSRRLLAYNKIGTDSSYREVKISLAFP